MSGPPSKGPSNEHYHSTKSIRPLSADRVCLAGSQPLSQIMTNESLERPIITAESIRAADHHRGIKSKHRLRLRSRSRLPEVPWPTPVAHSTGRAGRAGREHAQLPQDGRDADRRRRAVGAGRRGPPGPRQRVDDARPLHDARPGPSLGGRSAEADGHKRRINADRLRERLRKHL
jgi:hypothetical protein